MAKAKKHKHVTPKKKKASFCGKLTAIFCRLLGKKAH